ATTKGTVCSRGFFLSEQGTCLPCNCRGHAQSCEDITGICILCQDHSTGDFCERCQDGFMAEITPDGRHLCRPCACPISVASNNFAEHCDRRGGVVRCMCQEGYAGHHCERCVPGYYGNPMAIGDSCRKCDCNGNSDPNLIFNECNNVTGHCLNCWGNTAGAHCDRCAPGFHGDALRAKDCRECECNKCGTTSCDDRTGVCHCKPGVTGRLCDQCEDGYSGFSSCQGCRRCECAAAALRPTCHPLTHSCQCHPGAGGRYCERCLPGYWDYGPSGCQKCDCTSGHCDVHTGECVLEPSQVSECNVDCDECIWHLIGDVRTSNKSLDQLRVSVLNISSGAAANDRLKYYSYTAQRLQVPRTDPVLGNTDFLCRRFQESSVKELRDTVDMDTLQSLNLAEELTTNLTAINARIEDMVADWELYSNHQELDPEVTRRKSAEAETRVKWMRTLDLSPKEPLATDESGEAHDLLRRVRMMEKRLISTEGRLPPAREKLSHFVSSLSGARDLLAQAEDALRQTHQRHQANQLRFQRSEPCIYRTKLKTHDNEMLRAKPKKLLCVPPNQGAVWEHSEIMRGVNMHFLHTERICFFPRRTLLGGNVNGFVQKAIDASNVYDNIVKFLHEANITGETTLDLANRADDAIDGINSQLGFLKSQSNKVYKESITLGSEQKESKNTALDILKYFEETNDTLVDSKKHLAVVLSDLSGIHADRTPARLQFTQEVAESTLNHSAEVLQAITPIGQQVQEWSSSMSSSKYSAEAYDQAVVSAGKAVEDLSGIVPELLHKLRVVEEKKPVSNVSTNIMRIRELIAQARSVAKKVQVSMKFNGQSAVEVQPHCDVEEMKAVTSITLYMRVDPDKDPIEDRFILYLGDRSGMKDYMGLAIKNDNLVYVYNLGREHVEIPLSSKPVSSWPPVFNLIKVERLGRHGKIFLTIPSQGTTAEQKFIQKGQADGPDSLFDLDPKDMVFLIGGVPPDVKLPPPLTLAPFVGCIELASLNNEIISLYNFKTTHSMDVEASPPCVRNKVAFSDSRIASYLFDGTGYALVSDIERRGRISIVTRFDIEVRTVANNGVLLLMVNGTNYFVLELKDGYLRLMYDFSFARGPVVMDNKLPKLQINDARNHEISIIYHHSKKIILLVDRSHVKTLDNEKKPLPFTDIYIGGAPSSILSSRSEFSSLVGLKGCVRGFQFQKKDFNLLEEPGTVGISSGCPEESFMSRQAYFNGESYLGFTAKISPFEAFEGGFNFRTVQSTGLMFYHSEGPHEFLILLENGGVVLNSKGTKIKSHKKNYNDGRLHFLVATVTDAKFELVVDDKDKQEKKYSGGSGPQSAPASNTFYFGGSPASKAGNFTGCISYAYINRHDRDIEAEDFQKYSENVHTLLQECPIERPPEAMHQKPSKNSSRPKPGQSRKVSRDKSSLPQGLAGLKSEPGLETPEAESASCYLSPKPRATRNAHHYSGTANSRSEYADVAASINERSHFSLSLKTQSSLGLVFYVSDEPEDNFMSLCLVQGKLLFTFSVGQHRVKIKTPERINDGLWHNVIFIRDGNMGRLITDGLNVLEDRAPGGNTSWHVGGSLFVGGVPPGRAQKTLQRNSAHSFTGCVRSLQLNGRILPPATHTFGVTPCFEGSSEPGTYFSEGGGYVVLDDFTGMEFELVVEVRPRVATGVLLFVYASAEEYLTVYMNQGQVVVLANSGMSEFSTLVTPRQGVCDGNWHRITIIRDASVVQLDVDSEVNRVVGPLTTGALNSKTPVFVGGAPASLLKTSMATTRPYTGCMRNLKVNGSPVSFSKAALVSGAIGVGSCPAA
uniref:Laminin, alpha 4 n=1 Tax=Denticeps clupeoides TaxID=299321 RepID=A0AAY4BPY9_9TELE